jgi:hypothetical protein
MSKTTLVSATRYGVALLLGLLFFTSGCGLSASGPQRVAVEGDVTLDGSPLQSGVIRFVPTGATKGPAALGTIKEGRFTLSESNGPTLGQQIVEIDAGLAKDPVADATDVAAAWTDFAKSNVKRPREITIPRRYNRNSTLLVEVTAQTAKALDFKLASK